MAGVSRTRVVAVGALAAAVLATGVPVAHAVDGAVPDGAAAAVTVKLDIAGDPGAAPGTPRERSCSGALIAPSWVISAASCFAGAPGAAVSAGAPTWPTEATVGRADLTGTAGQESTVDRLVPHPERDVVLVHLAERVTGVTPVTLATTAPAVGDRLTVTGYGRTATQIVPDTAHAAAYTVGAVGAATLDIAADEPGAAICKGDAGGPALRTTGSGVELVAIHHTAFQGGCLGSTSTRRDAVETRVDDLRTWIAQTTAPTQWLALGGTRVGVVTDAGTAQVKEGSLTAGWVLLPTRARQIVVDGSRIGVVTADGVAYVNEGAATAGFVQVHPHARQIALSGSRVGVVTDGGDALVQEGGLGARWVTEHGGVRSLVLSGDRIGVVTERGDALVKEGGLTAPWVTELGGAASLALSGERIGVVTERGDALVKEGALTAPWVTELSGAASLALSGERIGVLTTSGDALVKEGGLTASWVVEHGDVSSLVLSGDRIGIVTAGRALVKEGSLTAEWTAVWK